MGKSHWLLEQVGVPDGIQELVLFYCENTGNSVQAVVREGLALWAVQRRGDELARKGK